MTSHSSTDIIIIVGFLVFALLSFLCIVYCHCRGCVITGRNRFSDTFDERSIRRVRTEAIFKDCQIIQYHFEEIKRWGFFNRKIYVKNSVCTICLEDFMEAEEVVLCPCKHCYHQHCIKDW